MALIVNGQTIDPVEIEAEVERLRPDYEQHVAGSPGAGEEQLRQWARENVIERTLLLQAAGEAALEVPPEEIEARYGEIRRDSPPADAAALKADIERQIRLQRLLDRTTADVQTPTKEEAEAFYRRNPEPFTAAEQIRAAHIIKHVNADADRKSAFEAILAVKVQLDRGASFEEMARQHSDCPERDGDLGYFARGQMVQEFEDVAFSLAADQVSDVFLSPYGYHICKVYDRRPSRKVPFDEVKDRIEAELLRRRRAKAVEDFVDELKSRADVRETDGPSQEGRRE